MRIENAKKEVRGTQKGVVLMELALVLGALILLLSGFLVVGSSLLREIEIREALRRGGLRLSRLEIPEGGRIVYNDLLKCGVFVGLIQDELSSSGLNPEDFSVSILPSSVPETGGRPSQIITIAEITNSASRQRRPMGKSFSISVVSLASGEPLTCIGFGEGGGKL